MHCAEWVGRERQKGGGGHIKTIISWQSLLSELLIIEFLRGFSLSLRSILERDWRIKETVVVN